MSNPYAPQRQLLVQHYNQSFLYEVEPSSTKGYRSKNVKLPWNTQKTRVQKILWM